jgi:Zn-dependent M32 family carboxypeptidase
MHDEHHSGGPLDFVRRRLAESERANARLQEQLAETERRLTVLQTAQAWALDDTSCWSDAQSQKVKELTLLLDRAHEAEKIVKKAEKIQRLNGTHERIIQLKHQLDNERKDKEHMRARLLKAFEGANQIKEENDVLKSVIHQERVNFANETKRIRQNYQNEVEKFRHEIESQTLFTASKAAALNTISRRVLDDLATLEVQLSQVQKPPASVKSADSPAL